MNPPELKTFATSLAFLLQIYSTLLCFQKVRNQASIQIPCSFHLKCQTSIRDLMVGIMQCLYLLVTHVCVYIHNMLKCSVAHNKKLMECGTSGCFHYHCECFIGCSDSPVARPVAIVCVNCARAIGKIGRTILLAAFNQRRGWLLLASIFSTLN